MEFDDLIFGAKQLAFETDEFGFKDGILKVSRLSAFVRLGNSRHIGR